MLINDTKNQCNFCSAVHAAVIVINEAIDRGVAVETFTALKNPNAMLVHLNEPLATVYQDTLYQAKQQKTEKAKKRVSDASKSVYSKFENSGCLFLYKFGIKWVRSLTCHARCFFL